MAKNRTRATVTSRMIGGVILKASPLAIPAVVLTAIPAAKAGPVIFDGTGAYTQNFDTIGSTNVNPATQTNTTMLEISTLPSGGANTTGWYMYGVLGTNRWGVTDGSSSTGSIFGMRDSSGGKALGGQGSSSNSAFFGIVLQNTSGSTIDNVSISFDAVINRNPATTVNPYDFSYLTSSSNVTTTSSAGAGTFNNGAGTFTTNSALSFTTPATGTGAPGTQAAISPIFTFANRSSTLASLGWANNTFLYLRWSETDNSGADSTAGIDNFSISQLVSRALTWNIGSGNWNTTTSNWVLANSTPTTFADGDGVTFANATGGTVTLVGNQSPVSTAVTAASGTYTFAGTASDRISGAGALTKSGGGTLIVSNDNTYSGGTSISGGILQIDGANRLGNGAITLNGGTLQSLAVSPLVLTNNVTVGSANGTIDTGGQNLTVPTMTSLTGRLTKSGGGDLTVTGSFTPGTGGGVAVAVGRLILNQASGIVNIGASGALTGDFVLNGPIRLNVNGNAILSGTGGVLGVVSSGTLLSQTSGDAGGTITAPISLNYNGTAFTAGSWTGGNYTPGTFTTTIGGTTAGGLILGGAITGNSDLDFSNNSITGGGTGYVQLNAASNYTGTTTISTNAPTATAYSIRLGIDNALPTSTGVVAGVKTGFGNAVLDMNGFNQQVGYIADGNNAITRFLTITNQGAVGSTLTISGSVTPGNGFGGVIRDGATNAISVVKSGANTQIFTGINTYTGGTSVTGGTLLVNGQTGSDSGTGTGTVTVSGTGTFGGTGRAAGNVSVGAGGTLAPGVAIGNLTVGGNVDFSTATSTFRIDIGNVSATSDKLVLGTTGAILNFTTNSTLQVLPDGFIPVPLATYTYTIASLDDGTNFQVDNAPRVNDNFGFLTIGGANTGPVTIDASSLGLDTGSTVSLDRIGGDLVLTVAVVPEPMSMLFLGGAGLGVVSFVSRRRKQRSTEATLTC